MPALPGASGDDGGEPWSQGTLHVVPLSSGEPRSQAVQSMDSLGSVASIPMPAAVAPEAPGADPRAIADGLEVVRRGSTGSDLGDSEPEVIEEESVSPKIRRPAGKSPRGQLAAVTASSTPAAWVTASAPVSRRGSAESDTSALSRVGSARAGYSTKGPSLSFADDSDNGPLRKGESSHSMGSLVRGSSFNIRKSFGAAFQGVLPFGRIVEEDGCGSRAPSEMRASTRKSFMGRDDDGLLRGKTSVVSYHSYSTWGESDFSDDDVPWLGARICRCFRRSRLRVWLFLEEPWDTFASCLFSGTLVVVILASIWYSIFVNGTFNLLSDEEAAFKTSQWDTIFNSVFLADTVFRFWAFPVPRKFFSTPKNMVDIVALLPFVINHLIRLPHHAADLAFLRWLGSFQAFLRFLKLSRYFWGWQLLFHSVRDSSQALVLPMLFLLVITILGSCTLYMCETILLLERPTDGLVSIKSLPDAIHFSILCMLSLSSGPFYGMQAESAGGRTVVCAVMIFGMLFMAMPIAIVGACFSQTWFDQDRIVLMSMVRNRLNAQGFGPADLKDVFGEVDADGSGEIDLDEFKRMIDTFNFRSLNNQKCRRLFAYFDHDNDGVISFTDFAYTLFPDYHFDELDSDPGDAEEGMEVPGDSEGAGEDGGEPHEAEARREGSHSPHPPHRDSLEDPSAAPACPAPSLDTRPHGPGGASSSSQQHFEGWAAKEAAARSHADAHADGHVEDALTPRHDHESDGHLSDHSGSLSNVDMDCPDVVFNVPKKGIGLKKTSTMSHDSDFIVDNITVDRDRSVLSHRDASLLGTQNLLRPGQSQLSMTSNFRSESRVETALKRLDKKLERQLNQILNILVNTAEKSHAPAGGFGHGGGFAAAGGAGSTFHLPPAPNLPLVGKNLKSVPASRVGSRRPSLLGAFGAKSVAASRRGSAHSVLDGESQGGGLMALFTGRRGSSGPGHGHGHSQGKGRQSGGEDTRSSAGAAAHGHGSKSHGRRISAESSVQSVFRKQDSVRSNNRASSGARGSGARGSRGDEALGGHRSGQGHGPPPGFGGGFRRASTAIFGADARNWRR